MTSPDECQATDKPVRRGRTYRSHTKGRQLSTLPEGCSRLRCVAGAIVWVNNLTWRAVGRQALKPALSSNVQCPLEVRNKCLKLFRERTAGHNWDGPEILSVLYLVRCEKVGNLSWHVSTLHIASRFQQVISRIRGIIREEEGCCSTVQIMR